MDRRVRVDPDDQANKASGGLTVWFSAADLAAWTGISPRTAARVLRAAADGQRWRGVELSVREVSTRGGAAGKRIEVDATTLPFEWRLWPTAEEDAGASDREVRGGIAPFVARRDRRSAVIRAKMELLLDALAAKSKSRERRWAVKRAAIRSGKSEQTIYRMLTLAENVGMQALAPATRKPAARDLIVSKTFDRMVETHAAATGFDIDAFARAVDDAICLRLSEREATAGMTIIRERAGRDIAMLAKQEGWTVDDKVAIPSIRRVEKNRNALLTSAALHDAEKFDDLLPRVRRTAKRLGPCQVVFLDIKRCNVRIPLKDGGDVGAVLITFYDIATRRAFSCLMKVRGRHAGPGSPPNKAVNQAMVTVAMAAMFKAPDWGVPDVLYTDNDSAMKGLPDALSVLAASNTCKVIYATPSTPQAKPVEGFFSILNRTVFSQLPGFTGGNAGRRRNSTADRYNTDVVPCWEEYGALLGQLLAEYHARDGAKCKSPNQTFEEKRLEFSFKPRVLDDYDIAKLFGTMKSRKLKQGSIVVNNDHYVDDLIYTMMPGNVDVLQAPSFTDMTVSQNVPVVEHSVFIAAENLLVALQKDEEFDYLTPGTWSASPGLAEADRRKTMMLGAVAHNLIRVAGGHVSSVSTALRGLRDHAHQRERAAKKAKGSQIAIVQQRDETSPHDQDSRPFSGEIPLTDSFFIGDV